MEVTRGRLDAAEHDDPVLLRALGTLARWEGLDPQRRRQVAEAAGKLRAAVVHVAIVGDFKRGKSSLVNALVGQRLLPTGVVPVTAVPTLLRWGEETAVTVRFLDGTADATLPVQALAPLVTEAGNPGNRRGVQEVVVDCPAVLLREGLVVVDMPGMGSLHVHNTQAARAFLPRIDVAIAVLSADAVLSEAEADWLQALDREAVRIAVAVNKVDLLSAAEREEALRFVRDGVGRCVGAEVPVFPLSVRQALDGDPAGGGLGALRTWLREQVQAQRGAIARARAARVASAALAEAQATLGVERAALALPEEQIARVRQGLERTLAALEDDLAQLGAFLRERCRVTVDTEVAAAVDRLRADLPTVLLAAEDDAQWPELEASAAVRWRQAMAATLRQALADPADRSRARMEELLGRFLRDVGDLFQVELPPLATVGEPVPLPEIRVEGTDEPGAVAMGVRALRRVLPGSLGRAWRDRARRQAAADAADRLGGRLRYAATGALAATVAAWAEALVDSGRSAARALVGAADRAAAALAAGAADRVEVARRLEERQAELTLVARQLEAATPASPSPGGPGGS